MSDRVLREFLHNHKTVGRWERLRHLITPQDSLAIIIYGEPDPDALASAWALQHIFRRRAHHVDILATQPIRREQNLRFYNALAIPLKITTSIAWEAHTRHAVVDAQPDFFQPPLPGVFDIVIDHHPRKSAWAARFADVRASYGATSTILLEYVLCSDTTLTKRLATALWYGLWIDSNKFTRSVTAQDLAAVTYLYRKGNADIIRWLEQTQIPAPYRPLYAKGLASLADDANRVLAVLGDVPQPDACVHVADFLARFGGVRWVAVAGVFEQTLYVVLRSGILGVNVGRLARQKLNHWGSAGGHLDRARAEIPFKNITSVVPDPRDPVRLETWLRSILLPRRRPRAARAGGQSQQSGASS